MKRAFLKLFAVLMMCFLVGTAIVSCDVENIVSISDDGYWVINGEKTEYKVQGDASVKPSTCNHKLVKYEIKTHTADSDGEYLEVCVLCRGYAEIKTLTIHSFEDGVEIAPTCTDDGFNGQVCSVCGAFGSGEIVASEGHAWSEDAVFNAEFGEPCMYGGVATKMCRVCKMNEEPRDVGPVGHVVKEWYVSSYPNEDCSGMAEGRCIYCYSNVEYILPALNEEDYDVSWKDGVASTCYDEGTKVYSYIVKNEYNYDHVWDKNLSVVVMGKPSVSEHVLSSKSISEWIGRDGCYSYYADVDGDGEKEAVGFEEFAGEQITCCSYGRGFFTCEACQCVVAVDNIYKDHFGPKKIVKAAACHTPGVMQIDCVNCLLTLDCVYYVGHNFEYELIMSDDYYDEFTVVAKCHEKKTIYNEDGDEYMIECWQQIYDNVGYDDMLIGYQELGNVYGKLTDSVKGTCYQPGYDVYTCWLDNGYEAIEISCKLPSDEKIPHTLNGKWLDEYDELTTDIPGIMPMGGVKFEMCGEIYDAYFECEVCAAYKAETGSDIGTMVSVKVVKPHTLVVVEDGKSKAPTCVCEGYESVKCINEGCNYYIRESFIPALGHDYTASIAIDTYCDEFTLTAVCSRGCNEPGACVETTRALYDIDYEYRLTRKVKERATCNTPEIVNYSGMLAFDVNYDEYDNYDIYIHVVDEWEYEEYQNLVPISFDVEERDYRPHNFCYEDEFQNVVVERDWNYDGVVDTIETYTYKYCKECYLIELVDVRIDQITEVTKYW